jgi:hypothetical protein
MSAKPEDLVARLAALGIETRTLPYPEHRIVEEGKALRDDVTGTFTTSLLLKDQEGRLFLVVAHEESILDLKTLHLRVDGTGAAWLRGAGAGSIIASARVRRLTDKAQCPPRRRSSTDQPRRARHPGAVTVVGATRAPMRSSLNGWLAQSSGNCRLMPSAKCVGSARSHAGLRLRRYRWSAGTEARGSWWGSLRS